MLTKIEAHPGFNPNGFNLTEGNRLDQNLIITDDEFSALRLKEGKRMQSDLLQLLAPSPQHILMSIFAHDFSRLREKHLTTRIAPH